MTQLSDQVSQRSAELVHQSSARAAQVSSLLTAGDYDAIRSWIDQWQEEDKAEDSLYKRCRELRNFLRKERYRQRQQQLYGSVLNKITGKATTADLAGPGDGSLPNNRSKRS